MSKRASARAPCRPGFRKSPAPPVAPPDDDLFQPYGGFPDGVQVQGSYVMLPELPGIGFEGKADLIREMRALAE